MNAKPKFEIGSVVYKHTGNYGGPGIVRGIANAEAQPLRYLVGHSINGGFGEFYHVYAEGNLREIDDALSKLPKVRMAEGLASRTGRPTPNDDEPSPAVQKAIAHFHDKAAEYETTELVEALATAHRQVDMLMATVIGHDDTFMPTQTSLWPDIVKRIALLQKYEVSP